MKKSISGKPKKSARPSGKRAASSGERCAIAGGYVDASMNGHASDETNALGSHPPLVELGLTVKTKSAPSERQRAALADLASKAIDSLTVGTADSDEKASRKRRLIKGPEEFREVRVDRPGKK